MSSDTTGTARANRNGNPCPPWCTSDHDKLLVPDSDIYMSVHRSAPMTDNYPEPRVRAIQDGKFGFDELRVSMAAGLGVVALPLQQADELADLLEGLEDLVRFEPSRLRLYAGQVRAAAAIARNAQ